jgi:hypothetical protein
VDGKIFEEKLFISTARQCFFEPVFSRKISKIMMSLEMNELIKNVYETNGTIGTNCLINFHLTVAKMFDDAEIPAIFLPPPL